MTQQRENCNTCLHSREETLKQLNLRQTIWNICPYSGKGAVKSWSKKVSPWPSNVNIWNMCFYKLQRDLALKRSAQTIFTKCLDLWDWAAEQVVRRAEIAEFQQWSCWSAAQLSACRWHRLGGQITKASCS